MCASLALSFALLHFQPCMDGIARFHLRAHELVVHCTQPSNKWRASGQGLSHRCYQRLPPPLSPVDRCPAGLSSCCQGEHFVQEDPCLARANRALLAFLLVETAEPLP